MVRPFYEPGLSDRDPEELLELATSDVDIRQSASWEPPNRRAQVANSR